MRAGSGAAVQEYEERSIHAIFFLISPEKDPSQHLRLLAQLAGHVDKEGFMGIDLSKKYLLKLKDILDVQEAELTLLVYPWPGQIYRDDANSLQVKIWKEWAKNNNIKIFPLDSEHFSMNQLFDFSKKYFHLNKIYLTASGGPFLNQNHNDLKNVTFNQAINHPKWSMGYKNSLDSATLVNKCLELIEAHYLFDIPFNKLDILIHPQALVHSIFEFKNYVTNMVYFYHDMSIPLFNFFNQKFNYVPKKIKNYRIKQTDSVLEKPEI